MSPQTTPIAISGPGELVAVVPFLLGFVPEHSLVIVGLGDGGLQCTIRVDLPDQAEYAWYVRDLTAQLSRNNCGRCITIAYGPEPLAEAVLGVTAVRLERAGIDTFDRLRVDQGRYWSLDCNLPCCPDEGRAVPQLPEAVLALIAAGGQSRRDRAAVVAQLEAAEPEARSAVAAEVEHILATDPARTTEELHRLGLEHLDRWRATTALPGPADIAQLGFALGSRRMLDVVLRDIEAHPERSRLDLWIWLTRHLDGDLMSGPATAAGWAAYREGNGVLALEAFDLALRAWADNVHARALFEALQAGIPPHQAAVSVGIEAVDEAADRA